MGALYSNGSAVLQEISSDDLLAATFVVLLADTTEPFGEKEKDAKKVLNAKELPEGVASYDLRVQVIPNPNEPHGIRSRFVQFFMEEAVRGGLEDQTHSGILALDDDGSFTPIARLGSDDVHLLVNGSGFAIPLPPEVV